jgi:hypothetical protein
VQNVQLFKLLTFAGTIPFIACTILQYGNAPKFNFLGSYIEIALIYGLVIASFMSGAHWGIYLSHKDRSPFNLFITSNILTVLIWLVYLLFSSSVFLLSLIIGFSLLLWIDYRLYQSEILSHEYIKTRTTVTFIVNFFLLLLLVSLW